MNISIHGTRSFRPMFVRKTYQQYHSHGLYQTTPYPQMLSITRQANIDQNILHLCSANPRILFPGLEPPKQLITKIERVQRFFTRAIPGLRTLPYRSRLQKLGLQTLEHRRLIHDLCLCHKILHEFIHCTIPKFPVFMSSRTHGHTLRLRQEKCSTTHRLHFLINAS